MAKKSLQNEIAGKLQSEIDNKKRFAKPSTNSKDSTIGHLWKSEKHTQIKKKSVSTKYLSIDTEILRERIVNKIAKLNIH